MHMGNTKAKPNKVSSNPQLTSAGQELEVDQEFLIELVKSYYGTQSCLLIKNMRIERMLGNKWL